MLLRNTARGRVFRTAHRSETLYHGPVVYADDPYRLLGSASSALEYALLRIFMKPAAHRGQREYWFAAMDARGVRPGPREPGGFVRCLRALRWLVPTTSSVLDFRRALERFLARSPRDPRVDVRTHGVVY